MADDLMDARLRAAGERWRAAHSVAATAATTAPEPATLPDHNPAGRHPRRWITLASAAVVLAALVAGGGWLFSSNGSSHPSADAAGLTGTVWRLSGYSAGDTATVPDTSTEVYFARDGGFVGDGECAVAGGKASIGNGTLALHDVVVRAKDCTDQYTASLTPQALPVLRGPATYTLDGTSLRVERDGVALEFAAAASATPPPTLDVPTLVGTQWRLTATPRTVLTGDVPRLHLSDDGVLTGSDGCNTFRAKATYDGVLTVRDFTATTNPCRSGNLGSYVDSVLSGRVRALVSAGRMVLTKPGVGTLTYEWHPADSAATDPKQLLGSAWRVATIAGEPAVGPEASLRVAADGTVTVADGCGTLTGTADVHPGSVVLRGIRGSRCAGAVGNQASTLDSFLEGRQLWSVRDGALSINGDEQGFGIVLTPAATDRAPGACARRRCGGSR